MSDDDDPTRRFDLPEEPSRDGAPKGEPPTPESDPLSWLLSNDRDPDDLPPDPDAPTTVEPILAPTAPAAVPPPATPPAAAPNPTWPPVFPAATPGNDFTTQRFDQLPPDDGDGLPPAGGSNRGLLIGLAIAGAVLVIAIIILLVVIGTSAQEGTEDGAGDGVTALPTSKTPSATPTPSVSETPSETPTPTPTSATPTPTPSVTPKPTPTPTATPDPASIGEFEASAPEVACIEGSTEVISNALTFSYAVANASKVAFSGPPAASSPNASGSFAGDFNCANAKNSYTLTATGPGAPASVTIDVNRSTATDEG